MQFFNISTMNVTEVNNFLTRTLHALAHKAQERHQHFLPQCDDHCSLSNITHRIFFQPLHSRTQLAVYSADRASISSFQMFPHWFLSVQQLYFVWMDPGHQVTRALKLLCLILLSSSLVLCHILKLYLILFLEACWSTWPSSQQIMPAHVKFKLPQM